MTPESNNAVMSPRVGAVRQDSQLSSGRGEQEASQSYPNVMIPGSTANSSQSEEEDKSRTSPLHVESILGIKIDQPIDPLLVGVQQQPSPLSNSVRDGGGSGLNSPHTQQSPLGSTLNPNVIGGVQDGRGPGRPDMLGFPVKSPSFRSSIGENQPSPLAEDGKTVSLLK